MRKQDKEKKEDKEKKSRRVEERLEKRDRKERNNNIIVKGLKIERRRIEKAVKKVIKEIRAIVDVKEVRRRGYKQRRKENGGGQARK